MSIRCSHFLSQSAGSVASERQVQLLRSSGRALDVPTEIASISVIQRDFAEKLRRLVSQNEVRRQERALLRENLSRANPEKTIQIARRFAAVQTTKLRMAIDPGFRVVLRNRLGGGQSGFSQHRVLRTLRKGIIYSLPPTGVSTRDQVDMPADARRVKTIDKCHESLSVSRIALIERHRLRAIGGFFCQALKSLTKKPRQHV